MLAEDPLALTVLDHQIVLDNPPRVVPDSPKTSVVANHLEEIEVADGARGTTTQETIFGRPKARRNRVNHLFQLHQAQIASKSKGIELLRRQPPLPLRARTALKSSRIR